MHSRNVLLRAALLTALSLSCGSALAEPNFFVRADEQRVAVAMECTSPVRVTSPIRVVEGFANYLDNTVLNGSMRSILDKLRSLTVSLSHTTPTPLLDFIRIILDEEEEKSQSTSQ